MDAYVQEEDVTLPMDASLYQLGARCSPNLMELLDHAKHLLVLSETGRGQTLALQRFGWWELCVRVKTAISMVVELFKYAGALLCEKLAEWQVVEGSRYAGSA